MCWFTIYVEEPCWLLHLPNPSISSSWLSLQRQGVSCCCHYFRCGRLPVWPVEASSSSPSLPNWPTALEVSLCLFVCFTLYTGCHTEAKTGLALSHTNPPASACRVSVESRGELGRQMCITAVLIHSPRTALPFRLTLCSSWSQAWTRLVNWVDRSHVHGRAHFTQDCHPQQLLSPKCQLCQSSEPSARECTHGVCTHGQVYTYAQTFTQSSVYIKAQKFSWITSGSTHTTHRVHSTPRHSFPHLLLPFWQEETWFLLSTIHVFISSIPECT